MNKTIVSNYVENIWNQQQFQRIEEFLHADFTDHSLPPALSTGKDGVIQWITGTSHSFQHTTFIDEIVCEGNKVMIKIRMQLTHTGTWRGIAPTGKTISATGYRYFELLNGKINAHWGLVDGNAIEQQLKETAQGCKIQG